MMKHSGNSRPRQAVSRLVLAALLGLAMLGLTQCRRVSDTVTGVSLSLPDTAPAKSECMRTCDRAFKEGMQDEMSRHRAAEKACGSDRECRKQEGRKHAAAVRSLEQDRRTCKRSCYNEGSGTGGI